MDSDRRLQVFIQLVLSSKRRCKSKIWKDKTETSLLINYKDHEKRANVFFELLKEENEFQTVFAIDYHKNLILPSVQDEIVYYIIAGIYIRDHSRYVKNYRNER